jgi:hypothetical protein
MLDSGGRKGGRERAQNPSKPAPTPCAVRRESDRQCVLSDPSPGCMAGRSTPAGVQAIERPFTTALRERATVPRRACAAVAVSATLPFTLACALPGDEPAKPAKPARLPCPGACTAPPDISFTPLRQHLEHLLLRVPCRQSTAAGVGARHAERWPAFFRFQGKRNFTDLVACPIPLRQLTSDWESQLPSQQHVHCDICRRWPCFLHLSPTLSMLPDPHPTFALPCVQSHAACLGQPAQLLFFGGSTIEAIFTLQLDFGTSATWTHPGSAIITSTRLAETCVADGSLVSRVKGYSGPQVVIPCKPNTRSDLLRARRRFRKQDRGRCFANCLGKVPERVHHTCTR